MKNITRDNWKIVKKDEDHTLYKCNVIRKIGPYTFRILAHITENNYNHFSLAQADKMQIAWQGPKGHGVSNYLLNKDKKASEENLYSLIDGFNDFCNQKMQDCVNF